MARTLVEWQEFLTARMDRELPRVRALRSRTNGEGPLPEMGDNLRRSWKSFQRRARSNPATIIVSALTNRIKPLGVTVGDSTDSEAARAAGRIYRDNRIAVTFRDAVRDAATVGVGYLLVTVDDEGRAVITREKPEWMYVEPDPVRPWRGLGAVKVWRDEPGGFDRLVMWADGVRTVWYRESRNKHGLLTDRISGDWVLDPSSIVPYSGAVPVQILENIERRSEFEDHLDLIDRINWTVLQRLVIIAMQAFRQRALRQKDDESGGLADTDEDGNTIDYQELFEPGPGALWELPPGVDLWESAQTSFQELLQATKDDWRELAAVTSTPLSSMLPDAANQSATGSESMMADLNEKASDRIERFKPALAVTFVKALQVEGVDYGDATIEVLFERPDVISPAEKYDAAVKARSAGESLETVQRNILGYSPDMIAQDRQLRAGEIFQSVLTKSRPVQAGEQA